MPSNAAAPSLPASRALAIVARYPQPGQIKTRLAKQRSAWSVYALYRAFLRDLDDRLASPDWELIWLHTPEHEPFSIWIGGRPSLPQAGETLNDRLRNGFVTLLDRYARVVIMSSDSPQVSPEWVRQAFRLLDRHDVVLGPCSDGGYYLIGLRSAHDLFSGITMSTPTVFAETAALARRRGLSLAVLPTTFDIDDTDGLADLTDWLSEHPDDLPRTRSLLHRMPGSPLPLRYVRGGASFDVTEARLRQEAAAYRAIVPPQRLLEAWRARHMALVAAVAAGLAESLRANAGIAVTDLAVHAAQYHDALRDHDQRIYRLRPWGRSYRGAPAVRHDGHEGRLAWRLRAVGATGIARIVRNHNVIRALYPDPWTVDEEILLIADAMADGDRLVTVEERADLVAERYGDAHPLLVRAFQEAYGEVRRKRNIYAAFGLDLDRVVWFARQSAAAGGLFL